MKLRSIALASLLVAALAIVGTTSAQASPSGRATGPHAAGPASLGASGGPGAVPWASVGTGWLLAVWQPVESTMRHHGSAEYLVLTSPSGARYLIAKLPATGALLEGWSGDGQRALLVSQSSATRISVLALRTGAIVHSFVFPTSNSVFFESAGFTRPDGYAIDVATQTDDHQLVSRYSFGGALLERYPTTFSRVGTSTGSWLGSPDGDQLVLGANRGLAIVGNAGGAVAAQLPLTGAGRSYCVPLRWWTASTVLARCGPEGQLFEFPVSGAAPRALTQRPVPPVAGDLDARHVGASVYAQVALGCGAVWVAKLHGAAPVLVHVPGVSMAHSLFLIGATSTSLALQSTLVCSSGQSLLWWTPSSDAVHVVLGPPITPGGVNGALAYPTPIG